LAANIPNEAFELVRDRPFPIRGLFALPAIKQRPACPGGEDIPANWNASLFQAVCVTERFVAKWIIFCGQNERGRDP